MRRRRSSCQLRPVEAVGLARRQAAAYFTAVLDFDEATLRQSALYELVLIARRSGDDAAEAEHAAALGRKWSRQFDDPPLPSEARRSCSVSGRW